MIKLIRKLNIELNDIKCVYTIINAILKIKYNFGGLIIVALILAILSLIQDIKEHKKYNKIIKHITKILLNIYLLII